MTLTRPAPLEIIRRIRPGLLPWLLAVTFFALYSALSLTNHARLGTTGYDLGIFEQIVRSYAEFRAPVSELKGPGFVMLGDHFHPILALLAPLYWIWASPVTLLLAQAALLAAAIVPITRLAMSQVGQAIGLAIGVAYGFAWGIQTAVDFDFHEVVFAVPLLAFALERLLLRQWTAAVWWSAPLILVKEDLPLTFAAIGGYLILKGQRRLGAWVVVAGLASFVLILTVLIPAFHPAHVYGFTGDLGREASGIDLLLDIPNRLVTPDQKMFTLAAVFAPTAFLAIFSPISMIAAPTLIWRFVSTNPFHWMTGFHYNAVLMPIVYLAMIDTLSRGKQLLPAVTFARARKVVVAVCVVVSLAGITGLPLSKVTKAETWQPDPRVATAHRLMDMIPDDATVAASNRLVPHLTNRTTVQLFPAFGRPAMDAEWVVVDTQFVNWPTTADKQAEELRRLRATTYQVVAEQDGFALLRRR